MVKDINSGSGSSSPSTSQPLVTPSISKPRRNQRSELWKSDGTASGTVMVKDINSGSGSSSPSSLTAVGNTLYFRANDGTNGTNCGRATELPQAR